MRKMRTMDKQGAGGISQYEPLWGCWKLRRLLGCGPHGAVYAAEKECLAGKEFCAVKHLALPELKGELSEALDHLLWENSAHTLPPIFVRWEEISREVRADGTGTDILIRMPLYTSLSQYRRTHVMTLDAVFQMADHVLEALSWLEQAGRCHGDIKPGNILLDSKGRCYLCDAGITEALDSVRVSGADDRKAFGQMLLDLLPPSEERLKEICAQAKTFPSADALREEIAFCRKQCSPMALSEVAAPCAAEQEIRTVPDSAAFLSNAQPKQDPPRTETKIAPPKKKVRQKKRDDERVALSPEPIAKKQGNTSGGKPSDGLLAVEMLGNRAQHNINRQRVMQKTVMLGLAAAALAVIVLGSIFIGGSHSEKPVQPPSAETLRLSDTVTKAYMKGTNEGLFLPENMLTRAEAAVILAQLTNYDDMITYPQGEAEDVSPKSWYSNEVNALYDSGVLSGKEFRPDSPITRGELVLWLYSLAGAPSDAGAERLPFTDMKPDDKQYNAIAYCWSQGWIDGYTDGTFRPDAPITRAETTAMLNHVINRKPMDTIAASRFRDVPRDYWAYGQIMAAATAVSS